MNDFLEKEGGVLTYSWLLAKSFNRNYTPPLPSHPTLTIIAMISMKTFQISLHIQLNSFRSQQRKQDTQTIKAIHVMLKSSFASSYSTCRLYYFFAMLPHVQSIHNLISSIIISYYLIVPFVLPSFVVVVFSFTSNSIRRYIHELLNSLRKYKQFKCKSCYFNNV